MQTTSPARKRTLCSYLPRKGRAKCSLRSNTEPKQPNSGRSSPTHRVRRTKRGNSAISSRPTRRLPKTRNGWQFISIRQSNGKKNSENRTALAEEEDQILKCLGAAVLLRWNTVPTKLQRELFDCASTIGDLQQRTPLKGQIARFLHNHKNDAQKSG
jgi:hypothetical protein